MLDRIIQFSIKNKLIIGLLTLALIIWGGYSVTQLPIDAVPDITNNQVQVITVAPSQSAQDIERLVTFPVEQTTANIPGIIEIRSFSRFGLSVVTIVFEDKVDVYWARQQVTERLTEAKKLIPAGVGIPELAPVTTGLGEIYQYVLKVKPGYEKKYGIMELRTIQDWIVRRQLLGTEGVADVSSFGGYLKQYEIALDPDRLRSFNISIADVFAALEANNQNTGGAYIEKGPNAYFIRSEGLVTSPEDVRKIVIKTTSQGVPVLISQVGRVGEGHAIRFGSMTYNGERETVGAVVMMLKGANSSRVISNVKDRIALIEKTLPEGVVIEPFLDRTKLVNNAISTVTRNLAEGALIVIFVLVLLLGNLRAGLVVASVIPLAMLFAVIMMNFFGVSGNLMSLGAIDFGLIVDGAVIIVEATLHQIAGKKYGTMLTQAEMDREVNTSAKKMMSAAAFGQLIILIVYLPILSLVGIEGKMFRPMAQTVMFAVLGALVLSLTYVPVISSIILSKKPAPHKNISDRFIDWIHSLYEPTIEWALRRKLLVTILSVVLFVISLFILKNLGGEFLPELDEGDFAVETRTLTGSSLSKTIDATLKGEKVLLKNFPEVEKVIGKIGSAEIPTDPMPLEGADLMVIMKKKSEWVSAETKDEMIAKMQQVLENDIPGVWFGFQHPIQMRFNELMTGSRQDVVVKIYGEDLDMLTTYADQMAAIIRTVKGTEDIYVEKATGLPQIVIEFDRDRIAAYGLSIHEINQVINTALAGQSAGLVFEGEKRFDLVVRLDEANRQNLEDIENLYISTASGNQIPLKEVARVHFKTGPNQIQRDDAKRRIVTGFNVRGRDVQSIVEELQQKVEKQINFAPGYYPTYGGTFKNLIEARQRLSIAVPVALVLIFLLLFFTFNSVKHGLLIFTAIPLSAIGGVIALWTRGMPFSISAGVGFIALFGVAVLNGIVLIAEFKRLKKEGLTDIKEIIMKGTSIRLRPVIMTAMVASLGFLPMALSHGSGAEVQKPLATVVIGGLISATLLTLVVLPCLYAYIERISIRRGKAVLVVLLVFIALSGFAQQKNDSPSPVTLDEAVSLALRNNPSVKAASLNVEHQRALKQTSTLMPKTDVSWTHGQYNSIVKDDNNFTVTQTIPFPTVWTSQRSLNVAAIAGSLFQKQVSENELIYQVSVTYYHLLFLKSSRALLLQRDSLYAGLLKAADVKYKTGESTLLEKISAETQWNEVQDLLSRNEADVAIWQQQLKTLTGSDTDIAVTGRLEETVPYTTPESIEMNPELKYSKQQIAIAEGQRKVDAAHILPDITVGYFNQTLIGYQTVNGQEQYFGSGDKFQGFQIGLAFPLWIVPHTAKVRAASVRQEAARQEYEAYRQTLDSQYKQALQELAKAQKSLAYYQTYALPNVAELEAQNEITFKGGEVDYTTYLMNLKNALAIRESYVNTLRDYHMSVLKLNYLAGNTNYVGN